MDTNNRTETGGCDADGTKPMANDEVAGGTKPDDVPLWNPANIVTCLRLVLMPIWLCLAEASRGASNEGLHSTDALAWCACGLYILISLTDKLDGWLARRRGETTDFGKVMDPLADKLSVSLGMAWLMEAGLVPSWMLLVVLAREFLVSGLRMLVARNGTVVPASGLGKAKTAVTMTGICVLMGYATLPLAWTEGDVVGSAPRFLYLQVGGDLLMWMAMILTVWSGVDYARSLIGHSGARPHGSDGNDKTV